MDNKSSQILTWSRLAPRFSVAAQALCLVSGLLTCAGIGRAQKTCIPPVRGVPGFANSQPNWYNPAATTPPGTSTDYQPQLNVLQPHDPRWVGAASFDFGSGTISDAEFLGESNVENGQTVLYLSWYMKGDPSFQQTQTTLYAGFNSASPTSTGATGTIIQVTLNGFTPSDPDPSNPNEPLPLVNGSGPSTYAVNLYSGVPTTSGATTSTTWTQVVPAPAWPTSNLGVWAYKLQPNQWAVEMRIPIDPTGVNGLNIGSTASQPFTLWSSFQEQVELIGTAPGVIVYTIPRGAASNLAQYGVSLNLSSGNPSFPDPQSASTPWAPFAVSDPNNDPTCLTGVYLADDQIGTQNTVESQISVTTPNTFFAKPYNYSTTVPVPVDALTATVYLANWGTQVGDLTPGVSWTTPGRSTTSAMGAPGPLTSFPTNGLQTKIPASPAGGPPPQGTLNGVWDLTQIDASTNEPYLCPYIGSDGNSDPFTGVVIPPNSACKNPHTLELHQCMLVKMNGPGLTFGRVSAFHNMDFGTASTFKRKADISVAGLGPISPGATSRDVYLFVETLNMPKVVTQPVKDRLDSLVGAPGNRALDVAGTRISQLPYSQLVQTVPTYIVRAYYDTGSTLQGKNGKEKVLEPETSFGYFVIPHGDVTGWVHSIEGATNSPSDTITRISPNWYKISPPTDGASHITTTVQALDGSGGGVTLPPASKFAAFLDLGANFPQGTFGSSLNDGFSLNAGLEYLATSRLSGEAVFGYHYFSGKSGGSGTIYQFSTDAKAYLLTGNLRPFVNLGIGAYKFSSGSTYFGGNLGGGVLYTWSSHWGVQGSYNFHAVDTPGNSTKFSTVQGGVRYVF